MGNGLLALRRWILISRAIGRGEDGMTEPSIRHSRESILLRSEPAKLSPSQELHSRAIEGSAKLKCRLTVEERGSRPRSNRGCRLTRGCSGTSNGPPNKQVNIFLS